MVVLVIAFSSKLLSKEIKRGVWSCSLLQIETQELLSITHMEEGLTGIGMERTIAGL